MPAESKMFYNNLDICTDNLDLLNDETPQKLLNTIHATLTSESNCDGERFKTIVIEAGDSLGVMGERTVLSLFA